MTFNVALVGVGPRGLSVLERLVIRLAVARAPVTVWAIDPVEHGSGRVWRTTQPEWFTMNATGGEVTLRSPDSELGWDGLTDWSGGTIGPVDYPARRVYGAYLRDVFGKLAASADVRPVLGEATALSRVDGRLVLTVNGQQLTMDKVVLATGHGVSGHIAPDLPLDSIAAGSTVAVRGLGLSFYDITRALTIGRGGTFSRDGDGRLRYRPSGAEPRIVAGSRTGLPFLARARFDQTPATAPSPKILTEERIAELRAEAMRTRGTPQLDFAREVEPLIHEELGRRLDVTDFGAFPSPAAFRKRLLDTLRADVTAAREGSPVKTAMEMLRTIRPLLPSIVDYGGLLPHSHRDFLNRFAPWSFILSAGPPDSHVEQLIALLEAGFVDVPGPRAEFGDGWVESPLVAGSRRAADTFVDARIPATNIHHGTALTRHLLAGGLISEFVNTDPVTGDSFATGGMAVTRPPGRVVDAHGRPDPDIYAIGVATEHTRWFTQVGTGRPGKDSPFCRDADAIALDIVRSAEGTAR